MTTNTKHVQGSNVKSMTRICDFCARHPGTYDRVRCGCCGETYKAWYCPECRQNTESQPYCVGDEAVFKNMPINYEKTRAKAMAADQEE